MAPTLAVGVLALQGAFAEHINLLQKAGKLLAGEGEFDFLEVRTEDQLSRCDALIIPGGESTTLSLVAERSGLLEPLREFVKVDRKPTWGTCAGLILLAEAANATKKGGQELIGGLDVRVHRNHFGRQTESFEIDLDLPFLGSAAAASAPFHAIFIRAPIVDKVLPHVQGHQAAEAEVEATVVAPSKQPKDSRAANAVSDKVDVLAVLPERSGKEAGDIVAVRQGNCFGTSFHPELTEDARIHVWWLRQVLQSANRHADSTR